MPRKSYHASLPDSTVGVQSFFKRKKKKAKKENLAYNTLLFFFLLAHFLNPAGTGKMCAKKQFGKVFMFVGVSALTGTRK